MYIWIASMPIAGSSWVIMDMLGENQNIARSYHIVHHLLLLCAAQPTHRVASMSLSCMNHEIHSSRVRAYFWISTYMTWCVHSRCHHRDPDVVVSAKWYITCSSTCIVSHKWSQPVDLIQVHRPSASQSVRVIWSQQTCKLYEFSQVTHVTTSEGCYHIMAYELIDSICVSGKLPLMTGIGYAYT